MASNGSFSSLFRKEDERNNDKRNMGTFVGTPLYVAPEMLEFNQSGRFTDLWGLGCILYELIEGKSPFLDESNSKVFQNIMERNIKFPSGFDS